MLQKNRGESGIEETKKAVKSKARSFRDHTTILGGVFVLKKEYIYLVKLLNEYQPCTSNFLANKMHVSVRTIKNYIRNINIITPHAIISSQKGYSITYENVTKIINSVENDIPQTSDERVFYIIHLLLQCQLDQTIDMFDLADELYVSISTLNLDLQKVRAILDAFDLSLIIKANCLSISGTERSKRRMLGDILYKESNSKFLAPSALRDKFFNNIDFELIQKTISEIFSIEHYYINDFSLNNLVLHIAISIDRIRHNSISLRNTPLLSEHQKEMLVATKIAKQLEKCFNILYNTAEINELALLILSRSSSIDYKAIEESNIEEYIEPECLTLVRQLIADLHSWYNIDFLDSEFLIRFALHIQSLFIRSANNSFSKNPLTRNIKSSCPMIYDVAVRLTYTIQQKTGIIINDDEIAYIAMHIGSMLEEQQNLRTRITAVLFCPTYYDTVQHLVKKIHQFQGQNLVITNVMTDENKLSQISQVELVISILPLAKAIQIPIVQITPFFTKNDQDLLLSKIHYLKKRKEQAEFEYLLRELFHPELFEKVSALSSQLDCIQYMVNKYVALGYTENTYLKEVLERENLSSTAFNRFAIPHTLNMNAYRTAFNVIICSKPLLWGNEYVSIIIMMCFNQNDRYIFHQVFEPLTMILNETDNLKRLINTDSFESFIETLVSML